tara:strand:+ start:60 stop:299 length:240 start_codon:yes stop_codon:yes gene_type:complete
MNEKYKVPDILEAVDVLLNNNKEKPLILENKEEKPLMLKEKKEKPLKLTNQVENLKKELQSVPKDTEKIILQAEKYLKK